ncbi:(d)CMP kinase [Saprospiraceae bacterium]|nr:(d)CMP kinase [Saprospiraceae bacterium]
MKKIIITIDGHSACGKSTLAKALANELNYGYIDTGAMYRAVTFYFLENRVNIQKTAEMEKALKRISITFKNTVGGNRTYLNGKDVEDVIRKMFVSKNVSHVSAISTVRRMVVKQQVKMGKLKGIVMEGRDIGTVVFPNAELKIFLTADEEVRVNRRYNELTKKGQKVSVKSIKDNLLERDHIDSTRKDSPLKKAKEAVLIDNSSITQKEQLAMVLALSTERIRKLSIVDKNIVSIISKSEHKKNTKPVDSKRKNLPISKNTTTTTTTTQKKITQNQTNKKVTTQSTKPSTQKRTDQSTNENKKAPQKNTIQNQTSKKVTTQSTEPKTKKRIDRSTNENKKAPQKNTTQNQTSRKVPTRGTKPNQKKRANKLAQNKNSTQQGLLKIQGDQKTVERKTKPTPKPKAKQPVKNVVQQIVKSTPTSKKKANKPTPKSQKSNHKKVLSTSRGKNSIKQKNKKIGTKTPNQK